VAVFFILVFVHYISLASCILASFFCSNCCSLFVLRICRLVSLHFIQVDLYHRVNSSFSFLLSFVSFPFHISSSNSLSKFLKMENAKSKLAFSVVFCINCIHCSEETRRLCPLFIVLDSKVFNTVSLLSLK